MKTLLLQLIVFYLCLGASSQDTTYYYGPNNREVKDIKEARRYKEVKKKSGNRHKVTTYTLINDEWVFTKVEKIRGGNKGKFRFRFRENTLFSKSFSRQYEEQGPGTFFFKDIKRELVLREGNTSRKIPLHFDGLVTEYYDDETVRSESLYKNHQLVSNKNWLPDGTKYIDNLFYSVDHPPVYTLGDNFLKKYITGMIAEKKLPVTEIQDELLIGWVITKDGNIDGVRILKGRVESVNAFFVETIESAPGKWEPALLDGDKVNYFITMPVNFKNTVPLVQNIEISGGTLHWDY